MQREVKWKEKSHAQTKMGSVVVGREVVGGEGDKSTRRYKIKRKCIPTCDIPSVENVQKRKTKRAHTLYNVCLSVSAWTISQHATINQLKKCVWSVITGLGDGLGLEPLEVAARPRPEPLGRPLFRPVPRGGVAEEEGASRDSDRGSQSPATPSTREPYSGSGWKEKNNMLISWGGKDDRQEREREKESHREDQFCKAG